MRYVKRERPLDPIPATRERGLVRDPAVRGWSWWWDGDAGQFGEEELERWPSWVELAGDPHGPVFGLGDEFDAAASPLPFPIFGCFYRSETDEERRRRNVRQAPPSVADQANAALERAEFDDLEAQCRRMGYHQTAELIAAERKRREASGTMGHVVAARPQAPPTNQVTITLGREFSGLSVSEKKKLIRDAIKEGMSAPSAVQVQRERAPADDEFDAPARCWPASAAIVPVVPPPVIREPTLEERVRHYGTPEISQRVPLELMPGCGWCGDVTCNSTCHTARMAHEGEQPSAVAAAPGVRPRLTIFCQSDED
jgi:hypothetical protein